MGQPTERDADLDTSQDVTTTPPAHDASAAAPETPATNPAPGAAEEPVETAETAGGTPAAAPSGTEDSTTAESAEPTETDPVETIEPVETVASAATAAPAESVEPAESESVESVEPAESESVETTVPAGAAEPAVSVEPAESKPVETTAPAESAEPGERAEQGAAAETATVAAAGEAAQDDEDDEEPYVPRVFAFDPDVPAVLVPVAVPDSDAAVAPPPTAAAQDESQPTEPPQPAEQAPAGHQSEEPPADAQPADAQPADAQPAEPASSAHTSEPAAPAVVDDADRTALVPVVPPSSDGPPAAATQVIPPVDPWARPEPVVRTSVRPGAAAPGATSAPGSPVGAAAAGAPAAGPAAGGGAATGAPTLVGAFGPVPPDESREASPFEGFEEDPPRRGWVRGLMWTGIGVLVVGGLYTGAQWFFSDKVPSGTTVAGVDVGGLTRTAAQEELEAQLGPRAAEPVTLTAGEASTTLDPATAGLTFDAAATAEELTAFSMNPARLWEHLFGGEDEAPVIAVDDAALDAQVETLRGSLEAAPVDGTVQFVDGAPTSTPAADGTALVADEVPDVVTSSWLVTDGPVALPTEPVAPDITQEETDAALAEAQKVVSAPVVVSVGGQQPELPPEALAGAASYAAADGALTLSLDGEQLVDAVVDRTNDLLTAADDAHFVFAGGVPVIEGGEPGTTIDPAAISTAVATAAVGDERTATVELVQSDPSQSRAALEALGVTEKVSEFSTPLPNVPIRTENLRVGASKVTGTLVKPGETFSLVDTLSPITLEGGYFAAGVVENGKHTEGVGGGLSQMATTTYNAGFFAGLDDVEHRPHSYWFERYPAGREATIYVGSIDMKFKNDTPYGVLMQSWVGGGQLHVAIWSTKYYDVETSASGKSNVVQPSTVTHTGADCEPTPAGSPGFSITNYRKVYHAGELVKDESYRWTYKPDNQVVCAP